MTNSEIATYDDFVRFSKKVQGKTSFKYALEWTCAICAGWDEKTYGNLYNLFISSTQFELATSDDATELKGRPLEKLARYFLEFGGIAHDMVEIAAYGRWQVDGQGRLVRSNLMLIFGEELTQRIGMQVYMEAKNHKEPVTKEEFSDHYRRMDEHGCTFGVTCSASGYKIGHGKGIAESVWFNTGRNKFHILLTVQSFMKVLYERIPPFAIVSEALDYALNDKYRTDKEVQKLYSKSECHLLAANEAKKISTSVPANLGQ